MKEISEFNNIYNYVLNESFLKKLKKLIMLKNYFQKLILTKILSKEILLKSEDITLKKPDRIKI